MTYRRERGRDRERRGRLQRRGAGSAGLSDGIGARTGSPYTRSARIPNRSRIHWVNRQAEHGRTRQKPALSLRNGWQSGWQSRSDPWRGGQRLVAAREPGRNAGPSTIRRAPHLASDCADVPAHRRTPRRPRPARTRRHVASRQLAWKPPPWVASKASTPRVPVRSAGSVGLCIRSGAMCARGLHAWRAYDDTVTEHDTEKLPRGATLPEVGRRGRPDAVGGRTWLIRAVGRSRLRRPLPSSVARRAAAAGTDLGPSRAARECDQTRPFSMPW